ncbi:MAG: molybdenum cofactor carrier protein [Gammaproteobacteria bacterium]|jgi:uncharacterized protein (TIGR00725 family)
MSFVGRATVGVMGSSREGHDQLAVPLGGLLARLELNLLTGGGEGVMTSVSRAYVESRRDRGVCLGIVPCRSVDVRTEPRTGYPNPYVELAIYTHLPLSGVEGQHDLSRNHINVLSSDVVIALPGGDGTASEVELAVRYARPVVAFASTAAQVERFDASLTRFFDIADVEAFLVHHLAAT